MITQLFLLVSIFSCIQSQLLEGIYCGKRNCYDVLEIQKEATKQEIGKNYRRLAKQFHPDLYRGKEEKEKAEEQFKIIATAYEILKDEESRADYDYMLDNPDQYYAHYYRYYRRQMAPKVDARIVIILTLTVISAIQYFSGWQRYDHAISYFTTVPKYRNRALDIAKQDGLIRDNKMKGKDKMAKGEVEKIIRKVIEDKMDIKGAYAKPSFKDLLCIQLVLCPYLISAYLYWYISWMWKHNVLKQPLDEHEKLYIIRKNLKMNEQQFNSLEEKKIKEYLAKELWIRKNFELWFKEEEENTKKLMAENNRYKQYRRYLKNHGVGRMTFDDS